MDTLRSNRVKPSIIAFDSDPVGSKAAELLG
jgi:hypothetical protein